MLMSRLLKTALKVIGVLLLLFIVLIVGTSLYITYRKDTFLKLVNKELNKSVDGTILIGDMHPQFFKHFPNISLGLENVIFRDKKFAEHHHALIDAKNFDLSLNTIDLLKGSITIKHIDISNAAIDLYTDSTGYSNTSLFKTGPKKNKHKSSNSSSSTELENFSLTNVNLKVENEKAKKQFDFVVNDLSGKMEYPDSGWHAAFHLDVLAKSMAFKTTHGSFIENKPVEGDFVAGFNEETGKINVRADALDINEDPFKINATFDTSVPGTLFVFHISDDKLLWRHASALLSKNISLKLNKFDIAKPIGVFAIISGNFGGGDPFLLVTATVRDNTVSLPGNTLDDCSFDGVFTNYQHVGKGYTDENSVIRFTNLKASYKHVPFKIDLGEIADLNNPIATGNIHTIFQAANLNYLLSDKIANFGKGTASFNLHYRADIVNYQVNKPTVTGSINLKNADIDNLAGSLALKNTSLTLKFIGPDLVLSNFRVQTGRSTVFMNGRVNNILNLFYKAPEKILLTLNVRSPQMYLAEFIGFLNAGNSVPAKTANSGNAVDQLNNVLKKGNAEVHLSIDHLHYNNFLATDLHADVHTSEAGLVIQDMGLNTSGGKLTLDGTIQKDGAANRISLNTVISDVKIHDFFFGFNSFGLTDFTYENLSGLLSAKTQITAGLSNKAALIANSLNGDIDVSIRDGVLLNFKPLLGVGKYAFPFRDLKHIAIPKLDAHFTLHGDKIEISPMQISSSVINLDLAGIYGLPNGTDITLDIPLRNPKGDSTITDKDELEKKRFKGFVLHLQAKADENGKVKIGLNKSKKDQAPELSK
jgi:hypothetical protein